MKTRTIQSLVAATVIGLGMSGYADDYVMNKNTYRFYETLDEAIADASDGDTLDIQDEITLTKGYTLDKSLKLTGDGGGITFSGCNDVVGFTVCSNTTFTLGNITINDTSSNAVIKVEAGAQLLVNAGVITQSGNGCGIDVRGTAKIINSYLYQTGTRTDKEWNCSALIAGNGGQITLGEGTDDMSVIKGKTYGFFANTAGGTLIMNGGTVSTYGDLANQYYKTNNGKTANEVACAICLDHTNQKKFGGSVTINGGTVEGGFYLAAGYAGYPNNVVINGGDFKNFCVYYEKNGDANTHMVVMPETAKFKGEDPRVCITNENKMCKLDASTGYYQDWVDAYHASIVNNSEATLEKFTDCYGNEFAGSDFASKPYLNKYATGDIGTFTFKANAGYQFPNGSDTVTVEGNCEGEDFVIYCPATSASTQLDPTKPFFVDPSEVDATVEAINMDKMNNIAAPAGLTEEDKAAFVTAIEAVGDPSTGEIYFDLAYEAIDDLKEAMNSSLEGAGLELPETESINLSGLVPGLYYFIQAGDEPTSLTIMGEAKRAVTGGVVTGLTKPEGYGADSGKNRAFFSIGVSVCDPNSAD